MLAAQWKSKSSGSSKREEFLAHARIVLNHVRTSMVVQGEDKAWPSTKEYVAHARQIWLHKESHDSCEGDHGHPGKVMELEA